MDPAACDGCPRNFEFEVPDEALEYVNYASHLLNLLGRMSMGLKVKTNNFDEYFLPAIQMEEIAFREKVYKQKKKINKR